MQTASAKRKMATMGADESFEQYRALNVTIDQHIRSVLSASVQMDEDRLPEDVKVYFQALDDLAAKIDSGEFDTVAVLNEMTRMFTTTLAVVGWESGRSVDLMWSTVASALALAETLPDT